MAQMKKITSLEHIWRVGDLAEAPVSDADP